MYYIHLPVDLDRLLQGLIWESGIGKPAFFKGKVGFGDDFLGNIRQFAITGKSTLTLFCKKSRFLGYGRFFLGKNNVKVDFYVIANCLLLRRMFVTKKLKEGSKTLGFRPTSNFHSSAIARAFDEFKIRWIPPVQLVYPEPAGFYFLGCSLTKKKQRIRLHRC